MAGILIWVGALFDFLDGLSARLLNVQSDIGKELDSLADMVTFSLLPSIILFRMIQDVHQGAVLPYLAFSIAVFSALRLARFNVDSGQTTSFIGLPTPANAILISSFPFIVVEDNLFSSWLENPVILSVLSIVLSALLVSKLRLIAFKFNYFTWATHKVEVIFFVLCLGFLVAFKALAIPLIVILYLILSVLKKNTITP